MSVTDRFAPQSAVNGKTAAGVRSESGLAASAGITEAGGGIAAPAELTAPPEVTVIVPTRNEAGNVAELVRRVDAAAGRLRVELIFVDDSDDETPQRVAEVAARSARTVRIIHRSAGERDGGLGGAVVAGFRASRAPWAVVMDGDLQHPPELLPRMLAAGKEAGADLVVASRYIRDGGTEGLAGFGRILVSGSATAITKSVFPRRLRDVTDPMSGYFAVRLDAIDIDSLRPHGFKILLEIAVRRGGLRCAEVPFHFGARHSGESKASIREGLRLFRLMLGLRFALLTPARRHQLGRAAAFGVVGVSGTGVNLAALWALADPEALHWNYLVAATLATELSTSWNFAWTEAWVFRGSKPGRRRTRFASYLLLNNAALLLRLPLLALLVSGLSMGLLLGNLLTLLVLFATRFHISDRLIYRRGTPTMTATDHSQPDRATQSSRTPWRRRQAPATVPVQALAAHTNGSATTRVTPPRIPAQRRPPVDVVHGADTGAATPPTPRRGTGYLPHRYDVSGVVTIGSDVRLRELEYFRAPWLGRGLDIEIRVGEVSRRLRTRAKLTRRAHPVAIRYEEHLGRFGANFHIDLGDRIAVTVDPLLARSPHVLYTNVIEALLRFVMVTHGKMLLHSACIEFDGHGVMLSARTDTGKTGTVLRLLREHGARFLSDDMTVLEPSGAASCFPKPLTISAHTLRAVDPGDMSRREWQWLRLQGLLHSKEGRAWGMLLGEANLPIMSINSLTQMVVPPPKYIVDRLVPSDVIREVQVRDMFIIERGPNSLMQLDAATALDELIENTDDAYGFPPFRYFAPALVLGDADYDELRTRERAILAAALSNMRIRRMASDSFGWADEIPALLKRASVPERIELPDEQRKVRIVLPNADQDAAASARPSGSP